MINSFRLYSVPLMVSLGVLLSGCVEKVEPTAAAGENADVQVVQAPAAEPAPSPQENNGRIVPEAPTPATESPNIATPPPVPTTTGQPVPPQDQNQIELAKKVSSAEALYANNPNDPGVKKSLANALYLQGQAIMYDEKIPPRAKYGPALKLFNRALALDPTLQAAAENKKIIEQIYASMGRPVPQ